MPVFKLNIDVLTRIKNALRHLTGAQSGHLDEALAACFGFRNHAALRAAFGPLYLEFAAATHWNLPTIDVRPNWVAFGDRLGNLSHGSWEPSILAQALAMSCRHQDLAAASGLESFAWRATSVARLAIENAAALHAEQSIAILQMRVRGDWSEKTSLRFDHQEIIFGPGIIEQDPNDRRLAQCIADAAGTVQPSGHMPAVLKRVTQGRSGFDDLLAGGRTIARTASGMTVEEAYRYGMYLANQVTINPDTQGRSELAWLTVASLYDRLPLRILMLVHDATYRTFEFKPGLNTKTRIAQ